MRTPGWICRWLVGGVLLLAGGLKIWDPAGFLRDVENYRLIEGPLALAVAFFLPWFEVVAGAGLWLRRPYRGAVLAASAMFAVFLGGLLQAWARGLDIECGCFGSGGGGPAAYPLWVVRDVLLLAACVICWRDDGAGSDAGRKA